MILIDLKGWIQLGTVQRARPILGSNLKFTGSFKIWCAKLLAEDHQFHGRCFRNQWGLAKLDILFTFFLDGARHHVSMSLVYSQTIRLVLWIRVGLRLRVPYIFGLELMAFRQVLSNLHLAPTNAFLSTGFQRTST
jgi:hypothetical protein